MCSRQSRECSPGERVQHIYRSKDHNWAKCLVTVLLHPSAARIGLGYAPPRGETTPYSFAATLRSLLRGHSVTKVHIPTAFDRIAEVEFSER